MIHLKFNTLSEQLYAESNHKWEIQSGFIIQKANKKEIDIIKLFLKSATHLDQKFFKIFLLLFIL